MEKSNQRFCLPISDSIVEKIHNMKWIRGYYNILEKVRLVANQLLSE